VADECWGGGGKSSGLRGANIKKKQGRAALEKQLREAGGVTQKKGW